MCETKIQFRCLYCGNLYDPKEELDCPACGGKQKLENNIASPQVN